MSLGRIYTHVVPAKRSAEPGPILCVANESADASCLSSVAKSGKPGCGTNPFWARGGLLIAYSNDPNDGARRAAFQLAKIIQGAKPGDLPIEQADKFLLVINLKTAKALGITVPATLLSQADEVIE